MCEEDVIDRSLILLSDNLLGTVLPNTNGTVEQEAITKQKLISNYNEQSQNRLVLHMSCHFTHTSGL